MRQRALIHVVGPGGAGKTTFVERLLEAECAWATCVRGRRDPKLRRARESAPLADTELGRYRESGAAAVALYRFPEPDWEVFFESGVMEEFSEAVVIEGDCPLEFVDLSVFVVPAPPAGRALLRREKRDRSAAHRKSIERYARATESREGIAALLGDQLGEAFAALALRHGDRLDEVREVMKAELRRIRRAPPPRPTEHWALEEGYEGIELAQLVIVNVPSGISRDPAAALLGEVARLRRDGAVFDDVIGRRGSRVPITAVVADLADPKDKGLRKSLTRVRRAVRQQRPG